MIHFVLHDAKDTVAVVVVEGVKAGMALNGWIMDEDRMTQLDALQDIPIGHKVALADMATGDTVIKYGIDMGTVVAPISAGQHAHVHNIKTKRWCILDPPEAADAASPQGGDPCGPAKPVPRRPLDPPDSRRVRWRTS